MEYDQPVIFVKLTAQEDNLPLWINIGQVMGIRERPEGGVSLLTQGGALHVTESLEVIFSLPPVQCWQVPEKEPALAESATEGKISDLMAEEERGQMPVKDEPM